MITIIPYSNGRTLWILVGFDRIDPEEGKGTELKNGGIEEGGKLVKVKKEVKESYVTI